MPLTIQGVEGIPKPTFEVDVTGLLTVTAVPAWWRAEAADPEALAELALQLAEAGERERSPDVCGVIGRRTGRPCRYNTQRHGPCPNHCTTPLAFQCAVPVKGAAGWCRKDLRDGPCSSHSDTHEKYMTAIRLREVEQQRRHEEWEESRRKAEEQRRSKALTIVCPCCGASEGEDCRRPTGTTASSPHKARYERWRHIRAAEATTCDSCGATPGELCRTTSGNLATAPHASR